MEEIHLHSYQQLEERACSEAAALAAEFGACTVLVNGLERANQLKKALARAGCGLGVGVETPGSWVRDLWETFGDGRILVDSLERILLVRVALGNLEAQERLRALRPTPGVVDLLSKLAKAAASQVRKHPEGDSFGAAEREALLVVTEYLSLLDNAGYVEPSEACKLLVQMEALRTQAVVVCDCSTTLAQDALIVTAADCCALRLDDRSQESGGASSELAQLNAALYAPDFAHPLDPTGAVGFVLPAGRYVAGQLLAQQIQAVLQECQGATVALTCKNTAETFFDVAPRLAALGIGTQGNVQVKVAETDFGRSWISLLSFCLDARHETVAQATDFLLSRFSFMWRKNAQDLDKRMRGWRGETLDDALTDISAYSQEEHRDFILAVEQQRYADALKLQQQWIAAQGTWPSFYRQLQLAACAFALKVQERAHELSLPLEAVLATLESYTIRCACQLDSAVECTNDQEKPWVRLGTQRDLSLLPPASFDVCVLTDLTAEAYPLAADPTALDELLVKLGAYKDPRKVEAMRKDFGGALALARQRVLLQRCLKTPEAEEERPSALFDELCDCYRCDPQNFQELHKVFGIPHVLEPYVKTAGEERVSRSAAPQETLSRVGAYPPLPTGVLQRFQGEFPLMLAASEHSMPHFSASALEAYLSCPYKWFAQRRLGIEGIDAQLNALAKGNFAHELLRRFHGALREQGVTRVTPDTSEDAFPLLSQLFDAYIEEQRESYASDAVFDTNPMERWELEHFRTHLLNFVTWEANLLPQFSLWEGELAFGHEGEPQVEYAGVPLVGSIDRVDVDSFGRGMVLDYKGSVGPSYNFRQKDQEGFALPAKIQALVYAQVLRRVWGIRPVGALYISYGAKRGIGGLYDETVLHPVQDLLGLKADYCGTTTFEDTLDRVEEAIAQRLEGLKATDIQPRPANADACGYCPVTHCSLRGKEGGSR